MVKGKDIKVAIASDLIACKAVFDQINIPWVIMGGIVLGYARYKDIMSWDTDLDMGVCVELTSEQRKLINTSLISNGFKINQNKSDFVCGHRRASFNMFIFHKNGDYYESFPRTTPGYKFVEKALWYDELQIVDFLDSKYPMPNHLDGFLETHYGPDWATNIIKSHSKYFKEKRGIRNDIPDWYSNRRRKVDGNLWWPALLKIDEDIGELLP